MPKTIPSDGLNGGSSKSPMGGSMGFRSNTGRDRTVSTSTMKEQEQMWSSSASGSHHYQRIYSAGKKCELLLVVPIEQLRAAGIVFSDEVSFASTVPPEDLLSLCRDAGIGDGWVRRAVSAGCDGLEKVAAWVQQQKVEPPPPVNKMALEEPVPPGGMVDAVLENGEKLRVTLAKGAPPAYSQLLYTLPSLSPSGGAEKLLCSSFARKKAPHGKMHVPGMRSWQVRWFELSSDELSYWEVGAEATLLPRETLPLSCVASVGPSPSDETRLDLLLNDRSTRFALRFDGATKRNEWLRSVQEALEALVHLVQPAGITHSQREISSDVVNSARPAAEEEEEALGASGKSLEGRGSNDDLHEVMASISLSGSSLTELLK